MNQEQIQSTKIINMGGLTSGINHIQLSDTDPGAAVDLVNFESSLVGGYRRISGFAPYLPNYPEVDSAGAEGAILGVAVFKDEIYTMRKQKSGATYDFYKSTGASWVKITTGLTRSSVGVTRIRYEVFNFNGVETIGFVDGVNYACLFDGTTWTEIKSTNSGANYANAGGASAIDKPKYIKAYKNHLFLAGDSSASATGIIAHSGPLAAYDFRAASGAGQLPSGLSVNQIYPYRDALIVFAPEGIKKIEVSGSTFVINGITVNIGNIASDSVTEIGGNLVFLSQDGFRPISSTDRIGDTNIEALSTRIQEYITSLISTNDMSEVTSVVLRNKSQMRVFFSSPSVVTTSTNGIIGCLRSNKSTGGWEWEWSKLYGIRASCVTSKYIGNREYVIHGDYNGKVYLQESGNSFDGAPITAVFTSPYLDFGGIGLRKTIRKLKIFLNTEGTVNIGIRLKYDWGDSDKLNPTLYTASSLSDSENVYGTGLYGTARYVTSSVPILIENVEGSGHSVQVTYSTVDTNASYTLHGTLFQYTVEGIK